MRALSSSLSYLEFFLSSIYHLKSDDQVLMTLTSNYHSIPYTVIHCPLIRSLPLNTTKCNICFYSLLLVYNLSCPCIASLCLLSINLKSIQTDNSSLILLCLSSVSISLLPRLCRSFCSFLHNLLDLPNCPIALPCPQSKLHLFLVSLPSCHKRL